MKKFFIALVLILFQFYILATSAFASFPDDEAIYDGIDISAWQGDIDFEQVKIMG